MPLMTEKRWHDLKPGDVIIPTAPHSPIKEFEVIESNNGTIKFQGKNAKTGEDYVETFFWDYETRFPKRLNGLPSIILSVVKIQAK